MNLLDVLVIIVLAAYIVVWCWGIWIAFTRGNDAFVHFGQEVKRILFKRLHVFSDDYTHVVAYDAEDAAAVYIEWLGCDPGDIDEPFERVPDKGIIKIAYERVDFEARKWWWWPPFAKVHS